MGQAAAHVRSNCSHGTSLLRTEPTRLVSKTRAYLARITGARQTHCVRKRGSFTLHLLVQSASDSVVLRARPFFPDADGAYFSFHAESRSTATGRNAAR